MNNRSILFGYGYTDGNIILNPNESKIVVEIFNDYLNGKSLLSIAETLNERQVEYAEGVIGWNKARLKRIIEDVRYLGEKSYPVLIDELMYKQAQEIKMRKNVQKAVDRQEWIFQIGVPVRCSQCNHELRRKTDSRFKDKVRWHCKNEKCRRIFVKGDEQLQGEIQEIFNKIYRNPQKIEKSEMETLAPTEELLKIQSEINGELNRGCSDKERLRRKVLEYSSIYYDSIPQKDCVTQRLIDIFKEDFTSEKFSLDFFDRTVKEIIFHDNGKIGLILMNDIEIDKEY